MRKSEFLTIEIFENNAGIRVDRALSLHPQIQSRSRAAKLIESELVKKNGRTVKASQLTSLGEIYEIILPEPEPTTLRPLDLKLDIVHEDSDLIVLNKPAGLVVHPAAGHTQDTLVNALIHHTHDLAMGFGEVRPGIVHRLDRDTSGLLVIAKNDFTQTQLAIQFKNRTVKRLYWALAFGQPIKKSGCLETYLKRHPTDRKRFASEKLFAHMQPTGKRAVTHYSLIKTYQKEISLLHLRLETGRTHQIRVHLSELGHPILADKLYGSERRLKSISSLSIREEIKKLNRICLHAAELGFVHPKTKQELLFKAHWPTDLHSLLTLVFPDEMG